MKTAELARALAGHNCQAASLALGLPVPGQELIELLDVVIVDACEHVGEPSLGIDVVEPRSLDQRVHHGGALAAAIGAGEQPRLAPSAMPRNARSAALLVMQIRPSSRKRVKVSHE